MRTAALRLIPILLATVCLGAAAFAPAPRPARPAEPAAADFANCGDIFQSGVGDSVYHLVYQGGVDQPIMTGFNVLSCSLSVVQTDAPAMLELVQWDPTALLPDPTTIALRARSFYVSALYYPILVGWNPPLVVRQGERLADPPRSTVALDFSASAQWGTPYIYYQKNGPPGVPVAYRHDAPPLDTRTPLAGPHPVLAQAVCGGDSSLQRLMVAQSVMTTSTFLDTSVTELMQRFRVPAPTLLRWVELAFGTVVPRQPFGPGMLSVLDGADAGVPPEGTTPLVSAYLQTSIWNPPVWDSHVAFDHLVTLEPDHDYWLRIQTGHGYGLYARQRTGAEGADFLAGIGPLYSRDDPSAAWTERTRKTLAFRLIGEPPEALDVPLGTPHSGGLRLGVSPNPARGVALVRWSGAVGSVRFEVLDARGRRVGAGSGLSGAAGGWTWRAAAADGAALPAGVYFVRATDGAGRRAVERVVVVR